MDYPRMLYRPGTAQEIWGVMVDTLVVGDATGEEMAAAQGWTRRPGQHPLDHDGDGIKGGAPRKRGRPRKDQSLG